MSTHTCLGVECQAEEKERSGLMCCFRGHFIMKAINALDFDIIKCGVEFVTGVGARPGVEYLLPHMERNENYVYWMQPTGGPMEQKQERICVNGTYYSFNNKLEKAMFRNVRLTSDFKNFERLVDGTRKLVIPQLLFQEKLWTLNRVCTRPSSLALRVFNDACSRLPRNSLTHQTLFPQDVSMMRKNKAKAANLAHENRRTPATPRT
jgi:hypothetical protein